MTACNTFWYDPHEDGQCMCMQEAGHTGRHVCCCGSRMRVVIDSIHDQRFYLETP